MHPQLTGRQIGRGPQSAGGSVLQVPAAASAARQLVRWGARHGAANVVIRIGLRTGDPYARMCADPRVRADPYPFYDRLRADAEVVAARFALLTAHHHLAAQIVRSPAYLSGLPDETLPAPARRAMAWARDPRYLSPLDRPSMLMSNGAEHARFRRLAAKAFHPRAVEDLAPAVAAIVEAALEELAPGLEHGWADLIADYAAAVPLRVIAHILGVPPAMQAAFVGWVSRLVRLLDIGIAYRLYRDGEAAIADLNAWMREHLQTLRARPADNLLSALVVFAEQDKDNGGPGLSDTDLMVTAALLLGAGLETATNLIGTGIVELLAHPDQLAALRTDPAGWDNAVEEVLRYDCPVQLTYRYSATDTTVAGVPLRRGQFLIPLLGAANRDPAVFERPDVFDVTRPNAGEHLSFSAGPHYCLGAALARLEARTALRGLFERHPNLALTAEPTRLPSRAARGYAALPATASASGATE